MVYFVSIFVLFIFLGSSSIVFLNHYQNNGSSLFLLESNESQNLDETFNNIDFFPDSPDIFKISFENETLFYNLSPNIINITQTVIISPMNRVQINLNGSQFFIDANTGVLKFINLDLILKKNSSPMITSIFNVSNGGQLIILVNSINRNLHFQGLIFRIA